MTTKTMYLVVIPNGTYEIEISRGRVVEAPPELNWLIGRTKAEAKRMIFQRDGKYEFKESPTEEPIGRILLGSKKEEKV